MNQMVTRSLQRQLDLEANRQGPKGKTKHNHENEREYARITQTPYQNMMLDKQVLRTKKNPIRLMPFYHKKWYLVRSMDLWSSEKARLQTMISMEKDVIKYSPK
jgi:hypothetical protein